MPARSGDDLRPAGDASGSWPGNAGGNPVPPASPTLPGRFLLLAIAAGALLSGGGNAAQAQIMVNGEADSTHVEVRDVPLREVLAALQAKFNLRYRSDDALEIRKTGIYNGPLQRVAARMLDGYDFAMKISPQGIDLLVLRQHQPDDKAIAAAIPARARGVAPSAPVMTAAEANRYERGQVR
jgi:hypothetical protein